MADHAPSNNNADISTWRILVVDDEPDNLELALDVLTFSDATVATATNGPQLLALVDEFKPSLILLDLSMPGMDGWEVQRQLRQRPDLNSVPIIALTALAMPADLDRAKDAGFDGYITKPFQVGTFAHDLMVHVDTFNAKHPVQEQTTGGENE